MALTMAATEECDMVMTGHSLGRNKLEHLLATGVCAALGLVSRCPPLAGLRNLHELGGDASLLCLKTRALYVGCL